MRRDEAGAALLEAIVALTILVTAGTAAVGLASQAAQAVHAAHYRETETRRASAFLEAVALWTRDDLDRRLGDRPQGPWRLRIDRPHPELYTVVLTDSTGADELLRTALFRPRPEERTLSGDDSDAPGVVEDDVMVDDAS